ncbi:exonuclease VII small subunit [Candidatus Pelagibacter sp.]|jgi:RNase adaptor protein for sRNA GlmZ degradation|uniref:exonuclease VII small subunit n=1 Tax=Candidatus Pelagibacter sp. TaxID=2024849 RepID=UPI000143D1A1|nr:MAG: exonuclease VII small subunit [Pseudomonadota bacterium]|tara:strand:+ start:356 stop:610 length:255 start_codon:yes stop_codon:yes gene_type:complete
MKDKILPNEYNSYSLQELKDEANKIVDFLEKEKNLESSIDSYQKLLQLNNLIEKKFKEDTRQISINSKEKIQKLTSILNVKRSN